MSSSARRLTIPHPDVALSQRTYLEADYTTGTNLAVTNNEGFAAQQIAVVGQPGHEKCESKPILGISGSEILQLTGALSFDHNSGDVIYRSEYDQIEISTNSGSGWVVLATIDIQWDQFASIYVHQGATDSNSYRFKFVNSVSLDTSEYSPTLTGAGYTKQQVGRMVKNVRSVIRDPEKKVVSDQEVIRFLTDAKDIVRARRNDWYFWLNDSEGDIEAVADVFKYSLETISERFDYMADIRYRLNTGGTDETWPLDVIDNILFDKLVQDNDRTGQDEVQSVNILPPDSSSSVGYIRCFPTPITNSVGSFYIRWYENEPDFTSVADTTKIPLPSILENYAIAQCEKIKGNEEKANYYEGLFYGPEDLAKDKKKLTGIPLLEKMQEQKLSAVKKPRQMKRWVGRRAMTRLFRRGAVNRDYIREHYW